MSGWTVNYDNSVAGAAFNDLYLDAQGNIAMNDGMTEVIENCYHAVQLCLGDYDLDTTLGIPWDVYLSSDEPVGLQIKLSVSKALLAVKGVIRINQLLMDVNPITRQLVVATVVVLVDGSMPTITI